MIGKIQIHGPSAEECENAAGQIDRRCGTCRHYERLVSYE